MRNLQGQAPKLVTPPGTSSGDLEVNVLFTTTRATLKALETAGQLAKDLGARIRLLIPHVVPYPLPLEEPAVPARLLARRFCTLAKRSRIDTRIDIRLCRDRWQVIDSGLRPGSVVVLAGRKRWWPTAESRLVKQLRGRGHQVVFLSQP